MSKQISLNSTVLFILTLISFVVFIPDASANSTFDTVISDYFNSWDTRVKTALESQPKWITPLAMTTPRLEQEYRYDQNRQSLSNGSTVNIYDNGKGLELIPTENTEIIIPVPSYQVRQGVKPASGLNDWAGILVKYRLLSSNEKKDNYIVTLFAQYGLPTGALVYTSHNHVFTPTLALGKGWDDFDIQATLGDSMPTYDHSSTGRSIITNVTAQYHVSNLLWPELELNRTDWIGGYRTNRSQTYLTTGIIVGRIILNKRSKLILGLGYQSAISRYYTLSPATPTFNHNWILSVRTTF